MVVLDGDQNNCGPRVQEVTQNNVRKILPRRCVVRNVKNPWDDRCVDTKVDADRSNPSSMTLTSKSSSATVRRNDLLVLGGMLGLLIHIARSCGEPCNRFLLGKDI
jgi:hypothetical protein